MSDPSPSHRPWFASSWRALALIAVLVAAGLWIFRAPTHPTPPPAPNTASSGTQLAASPSIIATPAPAPAPVVAGCAAEPAYAAAAAANAGSLQSLAWAPFHRPELGWEIYAPLVGREIGTACAPGTQAFAAALARWQGAHGLAPAGVMDAPTFQALLTTWHRRRPFVAATASGQCPAAPEEASLAPARAEEGYSGKTVRLRVRALQAYRRLVKAAREAVPAVAADPRLLTLFSGYRSPADDDARCAVEQNCQRVVRAACSAHRTGLAIDLFLGAAPGQRAESSDDANRLFQARSPAYRWLVANADRFGFVNYPFEPWHWEWTGEAP